MKISKADYLEAEDMMMGYCKICDDLTRSETEPDAEDYDCPECENETSVIGIMNALMEDKIEITEDDEF